jgi:hypothetical protein
MKFLIISAVVVLIFMLAIVLIGAKRVNEDMRY